MVLLAESFCLKKMSIYERASVHAPPPLASSIFQKRFTLDLRNATGVPPVKSGFSVLGLWSGSSANMPHHPHHPPQKHLQTGGKTKTHNKTGEAR